LKKTFLLFFFVLLASLAGAQVYAPQPGAPGSPVPATVTVTATVIDLPNPYGATTTSWEEIPSSAPATASITIQGCMPGGTCDTAQDTNTATVAKIQGVTFTKVYSHFKVTVNWTGGTNVSYQIFPYLVH
jgi:hypothetical protein